MQIQVTHVHKWDATQFAAMLAVLATLSGADNDPAKLSALTERLRSSHDALQKAVDAATP